MNVGVSIGSADLDLIPKLRNLQSKGKLDYVELYILPDVKIVDLVAWQHTGLVKYAHAPHGPKAELIPEFLDIGILSTGTLDTDRVVFDPGIKKQSKQELPEDLPEVCCIGKRIKLFPENMPYITSLGDESICVWPDEMPKRFTLDFAHATIAAYQVGLSATELISAFINKRPSHFHITDCRKEEDHLALGTGDLNYKFIRKQLSKFKNPTVTIETDHEPRESHLERIESDLNFFGENLI
jgi:hypothetical protein